MVDEHESPKEQPTKVQSDTKQGAWLEAADGKRLQIQGNLSIGRSPKNLLVLDSPKVSRRHTIINLQNVGEFWLIDLGSSNGTFLNKPRVHQPVRLSDLDQVIIGDYVFTFRQPVEVTGEYQTTVIERTIREIENVPCWLLVAAIETHEGMIDKYLGDGFFAYWREDKDATKNVAATLEQLKQAQAKNEPRFR